MNTETKTALWVAGGLGAVLGAWLLLRKKTVTIGMLFNVANVPATEAAQGSRAIEASSGLKATAPAQLTPHSRGTLITQTFGCDVHNTSACKQVLKDSIWKMHIHSQHLIAATLDGEQIALPTAAEKAALLSTELNTRQASTMPAATPQGTPAAVAALPAPEVKKLQRKIYWRAGISDDTIRGALGRLDKELKNLSALNRVTYDTSPASESKRTTVITVMIRNVDKSVKDANAILATWAQAGQSAIQKTSTIS